jgi:hypothetical protein
MFERFTDRSRRVVILAQEEARMLGHGQIGTEHLLLGLLHEQSSTAALVLRSAGVTIEAAREQVAEIAGPGDKALLGHIPFTPRAKRVLELALREALELRQGSIRPEHVLLGLIRERNGAGPQVLERLGGPLPALRQRVLEAATADAAPKGEDSPQPGPSSWRAAPGLGREGHIPFTPSAAMGFRGLLTPIERRLAGIERHLGIAAEDDPAGGFSGLVRSIDRRLASIERQLGVPSAGGGQERPERAEAEEAEGDEEPGEPPTASE